jgi:aspartate aminotransferase-like enzyme
VDFTPLLKVSRYIFHVKISKANPIYNPGFTDKYFRIGHMGVTVVDAQRGDIEQLINSFKEAIAEAGYKKP